MEDFSSISMVQGTGIGGKLPSGKVGDLVEILPEPLKALDTFKLLWFTHLRCTDGLASRRSPFDFIRATANVQWSRVQL